ncbi:MAG: ribosomal RNA small subunit methyltransferase A [Candidatus Yanofskybacteria bacterium RIFCSPHIGHO2_01_FULL_41_27]|nr:MAG: ribosomal RNA small subunit methyltransferase A [Candidatus Yanofskybacteria bacterium RIFCSPHIGHO2_01_FULL_41_27]OGN10016.1 MAG: ribosomal RNA small subunit methyltransferase A [Candidatus Yanofskybacteria bacterium RIFCSPHIGHO2_02_FULL_41_12]OGN21211.1 MAG: ribosomal RNA small subunit methyltransferase A [Candidatus Yanofskybacteria bacterium RIFCSPLOWO2_01_FULL_41_33]OGN41283.1 MAG: ribosomal RNA small subunit methyltransferase A [Candidatus Yanofskybacteria bacterium RIFOXYD1_FULL_42
MKKKYTTKNPKNIIPKKSLGQNFLVNQGVLNKIIVAAEIKKDDIILEVGPGTGNLTKKLASAAKEVIAVEKDGRLIDQLKTKFSENGNVKIIEGDILEFNPEAYSLKSGEYKIVANIPYYITSHFLRIIFESAGWRMAQPKLIVLMIQKEVAQRIMAKPPHMNLLALSVQFYAEPKIISSVSRGSFQPMPKVDSAIIKLETRDTRHETREKQEKLFEIIRAGFSEKRKQLIGNLAKNFGATKEKIKNILSSAGIKENARAENLSLEEWQKLAKLLQN